MTGIYEPRHTFILDQLPQAPGPTPADSLQAAAEMLARLDSRLTAGEARIILDGIAQSWGITDQGALIGRLAVWAAGMAQGMAQQDTQGDPLAAHLNAQASGAYALAPWPWPILTRESRSLMPGSVTILCGTPGAAKSWFSLACIRFWTGEGIDTSVLMLEETHKWHMQRALAQCAGDPQLLYPEWIKSNRDKAMAIWERHRDQLALVGSKFTCAGDMTLAGCADWVEQQCQAGKRIIIVDPISLADPGADRAWEADRKFMARAKVAIESAGASLVLVTHPRKANAKAAGPPELDDLAGGAAYGRACASAMWVAAVDGYEPLPIVNADGEYRTAAPHKIIRILKSRNGTGVGKVVGFSFNDLTFDEMGLLAGKPVLGPKPKRTSKPSREDLFDTQRTRKRDGDG